MMTKCVANNDVYRSHESYIAILQAVAQVKTRQHVDMSVREQTRRIVKKLSSVVAAEREFKNPTITVAHSGLAYTQLYFFVRQCKTCFE
jgi:hypothetical protein